MNNQEHDLPSDSDEDDVDYVPDVAEAAVSEAESEGDAESGIEDDHDENKQILKKKRGKRSKKVAKKRKVAIDDKQDDELSDDNEEKEKLTEEEEKKRADSLWADFMKDTGSNSKPKSSKTRKSPTRTVGNSSKVKSEVEEKIKVTKVFEFAGEEVKVEEEIPVESTTERISLSPVRQENNVINKKVHLVNKPSGIRSVLGQIGKKSKISTLEKSKLDWANFKKEENLDEEINTHNKGKDGYLERQDFLQRTDLRQFEIEKQLRTTSRRSNR